MGFMTREEYERYVTENIVSVIGAEEIDNIKTALQPLIGAQFKVV